MSSTTIYRALFALALCGACCMHACSAVLCRTGVDRIGGAAEQCVQCMNTSSPRATVYGCDYGSLCESILNLVVDGCVQDGQNMVCCCSSADGCNYGGPGYGNMMGGASGGNNESAGHNNVVLPANNKVAASKVAATDKVAAGKASATLLQSNHHKFADL